MYKEIADFLETSFIAPNSIETILEKRTTEIPLLLSNLLSFIYEIDNTDIERVNHIELDDKQMYTIFVNKDIDELDYVAESIFSNGKFTIVFIINSEYIQPTNQDDDKYRLLLIRVLRSVYNMVFTKYENLGKLNSVNNIFLLFEFMNILKLTSKLSPSEIIDLVSEQYSDRLYFSKFNVCYNPLKSFSLADAMIIKPYSRDDIKKLYYLLDTKTVELLFDNSFIRQYDFLDFSNERTI